MEEVIALEQLIAELGERHTLAALARQTFLYRVFGHHVVHGDVLADVADKFKEAEVLHPVIVVHHQRRVGCIAVKVEEFCQLGLDGFLIVAKGFLVDEFAFLALHRRVADHTGCSADERDGTVTRALEMLQHHHAHEVSDMQ